MTSPSSSRPRPRPGMPGRAGSSISGYFPAALRPLQGSRLQRLLSDNGQRRGRHGRVPGDVRDLAPQDRRLSLRVEVLQLDVPHRGQRQHRYQAPYRCSISGFFGLHARFVSGRYVVPHSTSGTRARKGPRLRLLDTNWKSTSRGRSTGCRRRCAPLSCCATLRASATRRSRSHSKSRSAR